MEKSLNQIKNEVYDNCLLEILAYKTEPEGKEYSACNFELNARKVVCRNAKITPKKAGQFVTFWKRNKFGSIEPFEESDHFDFFVVNVGKGKLLGQFVFPKSVLIRRGIISTEKKEGKRGFRVYPKWNIPESKQAKQTQEWQLTYFYEVDDSTDLKRVIKLYEKE